MLINGRIVQEKEDDPFIELDLRQWAVHNFQLHADTRMLLPYIDDAILLWERNSQLEYWAGASFLRPPYGRMLVVNHSGPRTDAILFEQNADKGPVVQVHGVFAFAQTEPNWSLRHAAASPNGRPLLHFDLGDLNVGETELTMMGKLLGVPDLDQHHFTVAFAMEVIRREVAANRAGRIVEGYLYHPISLEDCQWH